MEAAPQIVDLASAIAARSIAQKVAAVAAAVAALRVQALECLDAMIAVTA